MITKAATLFVIAVTSLAISRMLFNLHALKSLMSGLENMKFNTALCMLFSGIALFILDQQRSGKSGRKISKTLSLSVVLITLLTLAEHVLNWNIGLDDFFYKHPAASSTILHPGRMPAATAVFLLLFNAALLLMPFRKSHFLIHVLLITGIVFLVLMFLGIVLRLSLDNATAVLSKIFINSVFVFLLLFIGAFFSYPISYLQFSFQKKLLGVFGMVCLSLAILFLSFRSSNKRAAESAAWVEHTNEVLLLSEKIQTLMGETQAGIRGFFLTGDEEYLPLFDNGAASINLEIDRLQLLIKDNPEQQKRIDTLRNLIGEYLEFRTKIVNQIKAKEQLSLPIKKIVEDGKKTMDEARRMMMTVQLQEQQLLVKRKEENKQRNEMTSRSIILFFIIIGLLLLAGLAVIYRNIRKRNKAEQALRKSEQFIRAVINNTNNPISIRDLSGKYLLINKPAANLFNREEKDITGKSSYDFLPKETADAAKKSDDEIIRSKSPTATEVRFQTKDGTHYFTINRFPLFDESGNVYAVGSVSTDITEVKKAEEQLKEYKYFFDNSNDLCLIANEQGYFETITPKVEEVLGYSNREITETPFIQLVHPDDIPSTLLVYDELKAGAIVINFVNRYRKKDGSYLWFDWNASPNPATGKLYCIARDITERKKLEEELKQFNRELEKRVEEQTKEVIEKEQQYRFLLQNMREGIQVIGYDWRYLFVNNSLIHQTNYANEELLGHTMMEKYPGIENTELFKTLQRCMEQRTTAVFENEFTFPDGSKEWFELSIQPVPEGLFVLSMDITERKKAEGFLIASEETKRLIMDSALDAIICINDQGRITVWTPQAEKTFGWKEVEVVGKLLADTIVPVQHRQSHTNGMANYLRTGEGPVLNKMIEITAINREGTEFPVELSIVPFEQNGQSFFCGFIRDITERKKAEQKVQRYLNELKVSNTELERFAYIASHDLQEPLRMVSSFLSLLEEEMDGQLDETKKQYIDFAVDGAERMKALIQALLQYSRVGAHKEEFILTDLNEVASYVNQVLGEDILKNNAMLTWKPLPHLKVHKTLINQLFLNLVSNALKYRSDRNPEIEVGSVEKPDHYIFYVKDNGLGIETKYFDKIFVIFQRLHNKSEYSGTGIGLAICKKIVEVHNGKIWIESEPGKGSVFYFSIPKN